MYHTVSLTLYKTPPTPLQRVGTLHVGDRIYILNSSPNNSLPADLPLQYNTYDAITISTPPIDWFIHYISHSSKKKPLLLSVIGCTTLLKKLDHVDGLFYQQMED